VGYPIIFLTFIRRGEPIPLEGAVEPGCWAWALLRKSVPSLALVGLLGLFLDRKASREEIWLAQKFP
jgi:hypothetical protein